MMQRSTKLAFLLSMLLLAAGCHRNRVTNPIANIDSKQPDKVLFDRAMDAMRRSKYDVARITLQTLINTYPDSEYIARAKLAVGDSWYAEGTTAAYQQAEVEYKDFITFFPNLPEAAEAQLKIATLHYKQMEKPDRDFTHAKRAEDEYRQLVQQFPDSKLVPEAQQRLREVQEVLAEREFRIGRFYYLRESWPAAVARLKSLADTYPLYSNADEALMMLGHAYETEASLIKNSKLAEAPKAKLLREYTDQATQAYDRLLQRYPISERTGEARDRLKDMGKPIPTATPEAIAENRAEEKSRDELGRFGRIMSNLHKRPDVQHAAKVGEPTLVDPQQTSAPHLIKSASNTMLGLDDKGPGTVSIEKVAPGAPPASERIPRSDATTGSGTGSEPGIGELTPTGASNANSGVTAATSGPSSSSSTTGGNASAGDAPQQMPAQVNEVQNNPADSTSKTQASANSASSDQGSSSSKKKKKKGLRKIVPF